MRAISFTAQNHVTLLYCGTDFFPALVQAFDSAQAEIYLETYIFAADDTGELIKTALMRAAARGVIVNVITDWIGTGDAQCKSLGKTFAGAGINYRIFNPWFRQGVARTHRKMCVVDRQIAFVGGININDDLLCDFDCSVTLPAPRCDFAVRITGPLVSHVHREVEAQWARLGPLRLKSRWKLFRKTRSKPASSSDGPVLTALVVRDNLRNRRTIQRAYLHALGHAHKSALLVNAYFAPGHKFRRALESAARRGIEVTLLLGVGQFRIQDAVARSFYPKLLKHGVKIVEYRKTQLHGKVAVIDDDWATVGSSNYDGLSLFVNQEANVVIKDAAFSNALRAQIEQGIAEGVPIKLEDFANIRWYKRVWYDAAFWIYQALIRVITWDNYA